MHNFDYVSAEHHSSVEGTSKTDSPVSWRCKIFQYNERIVWVLSLSENERKKCP